MSAYADLVFKNSRDFGDVSVAKLKAAGFNYHIFYVVVNHAVGLRALLSCVTSCILVQGSSVLRWLGKMATPTRARHDRVDFRKPNPNMRTLV